MDPEQEFTYSYQCGGGDDGGSGGESEATDASSTSNVDGTDNEESDPGGANTSTGSSTGTSSDSESGGYVSNQDFSQSQPDYDFTDDDGNYGGGYSESVADQLGIDTSMDTSYTGGIDYNTADEENQRAIADIRAQGGYGTGAVGLEGWTNNLRSNFLTNPAGFMMGTQSMLAFAF